MNTVCANNQVVLACSTVGELHGNASSVLDQRIDGGGKSTWHFRPIEQRPVQPGPFNADEGPGLRPQAYQIGFRKKFPTLVTEIPVADFRAGSLDCRIDSETSQDADAVRLHCDSGPDRTP